MSLCVVCVVGGVVVRRCWSLFVVVCHSLALYDGVSLVVIVRWLFACWRVCLFGCKCVLLIVVMCCGSLLVAVVYSWLLLAVRVVACCSVLLMLLMCVVVRCSWLLSFVVGSVGYSCCLSVVV